MLGPKGELIPNTDAISITGDPAKPSVTVTVRHGPLLFRTKYIASWNAIANPGKADFWLQWEPYGPATPPEGIPKSSPPNPNRK
jgi:hypothetical protein